MFNHGRKYQVYGRTTLIPSCNTQDLALVYNSHHKELFGEASGAVIHLVTAKQHWQKTPSGEASGAVIHRVTAKQHWQKTPSDTDGLQEWELDMWMVRNKHKLAVTRNYYAERMTIISGQGGV